VEERLGVLLPVSEAAVGYKTPARYDDLLTIETALAELRRVSARFDYRILRGADLVATGHTVHACLDAQGRIRRVPAELAVALSHGERPAS